MKAHRRIIPRLTWFKLAVCICLAAMAASLFTPYPAQIIRALKGAPEQAPPDSGTCPPQKSPHGTTRTGRTANNRCTIRLRKGTRG